MKRFWKNKLLTVWIACFAILLNALAPSISYALNARTDSAAPMAEVCRMGTSMAKPAPIHHSSDQGDAHGAKHCPFCLPHAGSFALPPPDVPRCAIAAGHDLFPSLFYQSPQPLFSWAAANPRGPPLLS